jgi:hypothetical protein
VEDAEDAQFIVSTNSVVCNDRRMKTMRLQLNMAPMKVAAAASGSGGLGGRWHHRVAMALGLLSILLQLPTSGRRIVKKKSCTVYSYCGLDLRRRPRLTAAAASTRIMSNGDSKLS